MDDITKKIDYKNLTEELINKYADQLDWVMLSLVAPIDNYSHKFLEIYGDRIDSELALFSLTPQRVYLMRNYLTKEYINKKLKAHYVKYYIHETNFEDLVLKSVEDFWLRFTNLYGNQVQFKH